MSIAVIIPTFNEEENIPKLIEEFEGLRKHLDFDAVFINDGSKDSSKNLIENAAKTNKWIKVYNHEVNKGLAQTIKDGMKYAKEKGYDIIVQMDCDLTHPVSLIPKMVDEIKNGYDMVVASRYVGDGGMKNVPKNRVIISELANSAFRFVLGLKMKDTTSGFRCYRREVINKINLFSDSFQIQLEFTIKAERLGFKIKEIPFILVNREFGQSKFKLKYIFAYLPLVFRGVFRLV